MGFFFWRRQPKPFDDQTRYDILDDVLPDAQSLYETISERMLPGYTRLGYLVIDLVEECTETLYTEPNADEQSFTEDATWFARALWCGRRLDEANSEALAASEHHKVTAAFEALSREGFVTGEHLGLDQTSAFALASEARDRTPDGAYKQWAYAYFHEQDAAALADLPATLRIAYGAFNTSPSIDGETLNRAMLTDRGRAALEEQSRQEAGQIVADALTAAGLTVEWDGTTGTRIAIHIERWIRPLPVIDFDEAHDIAGREGLRIQWPDDGILPDATAITQDHGWWRVWATDERGGAWSDGRRFSYLPDALSELIAQARAAKSAALRVTPDA